MMSEESRGPQANRSQTAPGGRRDPEIRAQPPPRRGAKDAGRRGDSDAGERLLEAAGPLFADRGFAAVSTRALTRAAGVNLSAITYHFGSKKGLYRAVLERLVTDLEPVRTAMIDGLGSGVAAAGGDRHRLAEVLVGFVRLLVSAHADPALPLWRMQLILRELQAPSPDFAVVMDGHIRPLHDAVDGLVAVALGREKDDERTRLLAQSVIAECLQIGFGRSLILNRLGWDDLTPERIDRVARVIGTATLGMLGLPDPDARPDEEPR